MNERKERVLFESVPNNTQEAFRRYITRQQEEFSTSESLSRFEPEFLFASVSSKTSSEEEITREFYRNIGNEVSPSFRISQSLTITRNIDEGIRSFHMEAYPHLRKSKQDFIVRLEQKNNTIQSIIYDDQERDELLGLTYSPQSILSLQLIDDEKNDSKFKAKLGSYIHVTDAHLKSTRPTPLFVDSDKYVLLAGNDMLHTVRFTKDGRVDELSVPAFINGERAILDLGLQQFLTSSDESFNLPAEKDKWQRYSYRDFLNIEWLQQ